MPVDQFNGIQIFLPQIPTFAPFDSVKHYEDYLARLKQIPSRLDEAVATLRQGARDNVIQPKFLLEKTVQQTKNIADPAGDANPFASPVAHFPAQIAAADQKRLHDAVIAAVDREVRPVYV